MARKKKQVQDEAPPGAPDWMVTFSDCMTLLLTFFVLLLSFSSFDDKVLRQLSSSFANALPSVSRRQERNKDAFKEAEQVVNIEEHDQGSEKLTLERGYEDNVKEETEPKPFRNQKVFLNPSVKIFWGKGVLISSEGQTVLATLASLLREIPGRIVVSEAGAFSDIESKNYGLPRAYEIMRYLTKEQGMDKNRFSISATSTLSDRHFDNSVRQKDDERKLEIILLERSICK